MRVIKVILALVLLPLAGSAIATEESANSLPELAIFKITDPEGTIIGRQEEAYESWTYGSTEMRRRYMSFSIDGHDPVSSFSRVMITRDETGAATMIEAEFGNLQVNGLYLVEIMDGTALISREVGDDSRSYQQELPAGLPIADPEALTPRVSGAFLAFDMGSGRFVERSVRLADQPEASRYDGQLRISYSDGFPVDIWVIDRDETGGVAGAVHPQPGSPFRYQRTEERFEVDRGGRISHPMIASPHTIGSNSKRGHIRYRLGLASELAELVPENSQQSVLLSEDGVRIDICEACGPGLPDDPETLEKYTRPTEWLQSDFGPIASRGAAIARQKTSERRKLRLLGRLVRNRLDELDHNGHYTARAAWERGKGDCTEDAVLLAAMARAAGIPTLVVSGIAYSRERYHGATSSFIPHAWVVSYVDGEWVSYDMTLREGFGASHIALTMGEGEAGMMIASNMLAGMIEWQSISEVRPRPEE